MRIYWWKHPGFMAGMILAVALMLIAACSEAPQAPGSENNMETPGPSPDEGRCADLYPCENISLLARLSPDELLGERLNDIWGWTDPATGNEYALVGLTDRVTFVDISNPAEPVVVGTLPEAVHAQPAGARQDLRMPYHDDEGGGQEGKSAWRDVKVYRDHAFIVSDGQPHGLQVFDLRRLRTVEDPPALFTEDLHYTDFGNAHNIAVNEASGFAYVTGSNRFGGGLYIMDIRDPQNPRLAGHHTEPSVGRTSPGYVHDTQCVIYQGPDPDYTGREVCFNASETHLVIADVTDKQQPRTIAQRSYAGNSYAHQGWLTEDQRYFLLDDELDERNLGQQTTTYIWDVRDLDEPQLVESASSVRRSIDHNQYVKGGYTYQANYTAGLRIMDLSEVASGTLTEAAYFDTFPSDDAPRFEGAWSVFPYFGSGTIVVSDITNGLFILRAALDAQE